MQHECNDCGHQFSWGTNDSGIELAAQCPSCHSYHTQPYRAQPSPTVSDMAPRNMPDTGGDDEEDPGGNPLAEGDYKNRDVRDESWGGGTTGHRISLFETPEFETTEIVSPQDVYRDTLKDESAHRANIQLPKGITDNLHATLGNLGAWVENPYENSQLRPYNEYWKSIRPSFMKPGSFQIGVANPIMAEIINHVAQTDDPTPLYEYRGKQSHIKVGVALVPELAAEVEGATSAGGIGGAMNKALGVGRGIQGVKGLGTGLGWIDDALGMGTQPGGNAGGSGGMPIQDTSYYARTASDEDDANPAVHGEIPKNDDGDAKQKDDGNNHEWQRDISVNGVGGADHVPSFDAGGPAFQRFLMLVPLLKQLVESGEDASQDPLIQGLHQSLEAEIPGYLDHGDEAAGHQLLLLLSPENKASEAPGSPSKAPGEANEPDHTDENSGGKHESKVASLSGEAAEFLPNFIVTPPSLRGAAYPSEMGPQTPEEENLFSERWPKNQLEHCPYCGHYAPTALGLCAGCGREVYQTPQHQEQVIDAGHTAAMPMPMPPPGAMPPGPPGAMAPGPPGAMPSTAFGAPGVPSAPPSPGDDSQGPTTDEQQAWFAQWLQDHGRAEEIPTMIANPQLYAKDFALARDREVPPQAGDAQSAQDPEPAQESAPPGETMPVPGMDMGSPSMAMASAVRRYAADSIAAVCPACGGHTTELLNDEGDSRCHGCQTLFKTKGLLPKSIHKNNSASTWNVDQDLRKKAEIEDGSHDFDPDTGEAIQGVPAADQHQQEDLRKEQDSGHTWLDEDGNPLQVGQQYEMYSDKYDIPDLVRIEAVKPTSIVYTLTGEFGLEHSTELTKEEANIERITFSSSQGDGELGPDDADSLEQNNDDNTGYTSPGMRDVSAPAGMVSANVISSGVTTDNPKLSWLMTGVPKTAGADYTPYEQRALIDEPGLARNADMLDLVGTHYVTDADPDQFLFGL